MGSLFSQFLTLLWKTLSHPLFLDVDDICTALPKPFNNFSFFRTVNKIYSRIEVDDKIAFLDTDITKQVGQFTNHISILITKKRHAEDYESHYSSQVIYVHTFFLELRAFVAQD